MLKEKLMPPYAPYKGQRDDMQQLKDKTGATFTQITRDAIAAHVKRELKK
tara:strand:+ start:432 stop:581 length:150 start_codon:yes stop_codon:yes gene_type:complete